MKVNNLIKIIDKYGVDLLNFDFNNNIIIIKTEEAKICVKRDIIKIRIINYHKNAKTTKK